MLLLHQIIYWVFFKRHTWPPIFSCCTLFLGHLADSIGSAKPLGLTVPLTSSPWPKSFMNSFRSLKASKNISSYYFLDWPSIKYFFNFYGLCFEIIMVEFWSLMPFLWSINLKISSCMTRFMIHKTLFIFSFWRDIGLNCMMLKWAGTHLNIAVIGRHGCGYRLCP